MGVCASTDGQGKSQGGGEAQAPDNSERGPASHHKSMFHGVKEEWQTVKGGQQEKERMQNIFAKPIDMMADFKAPFYAKSDDEKEFIKTAIADNFVFSNLGGKEEEMLVNAFEAFTAPAKTNVIKQGDVGDYFYIIKKGSIDIFVNGKKVMVLSDGGTFGELALLYNCPRAATCFAFAGCELYRVDQVTFRKILASNKMQADNQVFDVLKKVEIFKGLGEYSLRKIADTLKEQTFKAREFVFHKGDEGDIFYVVKEGTVLNTEIEVGETKYSDVEKKPGDYFGERALTTGEPRAANAVAKTDCTLLCMSRADFVKYIGPLENLIRKSQYKTKLKGIPAIANELNSEDIEYLVNLFQTVQFESNTSVATFKQSYRPAIFFVVSGSVSRIDANGDVLVIGVDEYFCTDDDFNKRHWKGEVKSKYTYMTKEKTVFERLPLAAVRDLISRNKMQKGEPRDSIVKEKVDLKSLKKHRILGAGTFGQVWLVSHRTTKTNYALKIQSKRTILNFDQVEGVIREKNIMREIESPFIIEMINAFQDRHCLYMVVMLYQGGELHSLMYKDSEIARNNAPFYAGCVFEGLDYMHQRKMIYRDLKPENVMFGADGYAVIIDLGFAKVVPNKTYTLCGTPLYIAPEVLLQRGHDKGADIWSFAILIFELSVGKTPFYDKGIDQATLFKNISKCKYKIPKDMDPATVDLVKQLLLRNPSHRLGCLARGGKDVKEHHWFKDIDFDKLADKAITPPWKPKIKNAMDCSNFGDWDHLKDDYKKEKKLTPQENALFVKY